MATCTFKLGIEQCVSELQKITRDDLYGSRRVQAFSADNKALQRAGVIEEGNLYLVKAFRPSLTCAAGLTATSIAARCT
jgi:hypothetical protein